LNRKDYTKSDPGKNIFIDKIIYKLIPEKNENFYKMVKEIPGKFFIGLRIECSLTKKFFLNLI
jgi:hypothetical protein